MPLNQTQKRSLAKNLIANYLIISPSEGRLSLYRPVAFDGLVDFIIRDSKTRRTLLCRVAVLARLFAELKKIMS